MSDPRKRYNVGDKVWVTPQKWLTCAAIVLGVHGGDVYSIKLIGGDQRDVPATQLEPRNPKDKF